MGSINSNIENRIIELTKERKQLHNQDKSITIYPYVAEMIFNEYGEHIGAEKLREVCRRFREKNSLNENFELIKSSSETTDQKEFNLTEAILKDLQKGIDKSFLLEKYKISDRILDATLEDFKDNGYVIESIGSKIILCKNIIPKENIYELDWNGDKIIRFGCVSDTHIGSKSQQITHLNTIYDIFKREGIANVYHPGDLSEGEGMRQGHQYECFLHGADEIERYIIKNYPSRLGMKTHFITGNHDTSTIKSCGHDMGVYIANKRDDMNYLGVLNAKVNLTPNCTLELNHPLDGASYAISYTIQKTIDAMTGGEKPNIFCNGHHHKAMYMFYRNIHALECGTFEAQTPWMKGKKLAAHVGGWIIEVHVNDEGTITRFMPEFIPFYEMTKEDY